MHKTVRKTIRVNVEVDDNLAAYDAILNNPNCSILKELELKVTEKFYGDEGGLTSQKDQIYLVVTYEERMML